MCRYEIFVLEYSLSSYGNGGGGLEHLQSSYEEEEERELEEENGMEIVEYRRQRIF